MSKLNALGLVAVCACGAAWAESAPDRVGFPSGYLGFEVLRTAGFKERQQVGTVYGNRDAAGVRDAAALPYPYGSLILMEWRAALKNAAGELLLDPSGEMQKGAVVRIDVMRRERGFGQGYGADGAGEWEFASYGPGGGALIPAGDPAACARCHKGAGPARDFVFRARFPEEARKQ